MSMIAPVANVGLDMAGKIGGVGLNMTAKGGDKILDVGNQVIQHKVELVNTGGQNLIGVGRTVVGKMDSIKNSASGLTSVVGSKLGSAASGLTSTLSGSASASGGVSTSNGLSGRLTSLFG